MRDDLLLSRQRRLLPPAACVNCPACERSQAVLDTPEPAWWDDSRLWETVGWLVKFLGVSAFLVAAVVGCTTIG